MSGLPKPTVGEVSEPHLLELKLADKRVELRLAIPRDLVYFRGHFPAFAVLPGVVQVHWVMNYGRCYFNLGDISAGAVLIKFRRLILPGDQLSLTLAYQPIRNQIDFSYANAEGTLSSGRIGLEPV
jgi:3-hydroxymyristoyl/3-hydroxydecanoyl-(acyl carrier protein) dehydratase